MKNSEDKYRKKNLDHILEKNFILYWRIIEDNITKGVGSIRSVFGHLQF